MPPNPQLDEQPEKEQVLSLGQDDACAISGLPDPEGEHRPAAGLPGRRLHLVTDFAQAGVRHGDSGTRAHFSQMFQ